MLYYAAVADREYRKVSLLPPRGWLASMCYSRSDSSPGGPRGQNCEIWRARAVRSHSYDRATTRRLDCAEISGTWFSERSSIN